MNYGLPVQATYNLLAGIQPTISRVNPKFLGSNEPDPACLDSGRTGDSDLPIQTWAFFLESTADINTVGIFYKDKPERPPLFEVRVGINSDFSKNPRCAVSDASDPGRAWLSCGLKGDVVSVTFCGEHEELEISAYSLLGINLRKVFTATAQLGEDLGSISWVS